MKKEEVLEQYKLYASLADKISERRSQLGKFYISIITLLLSVLTLGIKYSYFQNSLISLAILYVSSVAICILWYSHILSYKQLNKIKFKVLHEIEELLPYKGFQREWEIQKEFDLKYKRLTKIEQIIPILFIGIFTLISIYQLMRNIKIV